MVIDPVVLASLTSAVTVLANDYLKGVGTEAGKSTWTAIKALFGWTSDPTPAEVPNKVASGLLASPELSEQLFRLLKVSDTEASAAIVGRLEAAGGKVVVAQSITAHNFQM